MSLSLEEAMAQHKKSGFKLYQGPKLTGKRFVLTSSMKEFPHALRTIPQPPKELYGVGNIKALQEGLAVIGARRATPYGLACARAFAGHAAKRGVCIVSGGALGCDSEAHKASLEAGGTTVVFLGGGCDQVYPASNYGLFQKIIDAGGAIVSENEWEFPALTYTFRQRNRLIAGLAKATLIVEAGLPSGTFSTADEALAANKDVLVVPGAISSHTSAGSNQLLFQGATPVIDIESFDSILASMFGLLKQEQAAQTKPPRTQIDPLLSALQAEPMRLEDIFERVPAPKGKGSKRDKLQVRLVELEAQGLVKRYLDGRYGPAVV